MNHHIRTQHYAQTAYPLVAAIKHSPIEAKYRTLALAYPTMIMQAGLAQAVGFLIAKGGEEHRKLLQHLATLLLGKDDTQKLHEDVLKADLRRYQYLTRQSLDATAWLKRYTQALLGSPNNTAGEQR